MGRVPPSTSCASVDAGVKSTIWLGKSEVSLLSIILHASPRLHDPFGPFLFPVLVPPLPRNCSSLPILLGSASPSPRLPATSNPALLGPLLPRDCVRCPEPVSAIRAVSSSNTSSRSNQAFMTGPEHVLVLKVKAQAPFELHADAKLKLRGQMGPVRALRKGNIEAESRGDVIAKS